MKLRDLRFAPPGGWKYREERTGFWSTGITFDQMVGRAAQHRINMKFPLATPPFETLASEIEDWTCRRLSEEDRERFCEVKPRVPSMQPGHVFSSVIKSITGRYAVTCGRCMERMGQMNRWGWWGCWKQRNLIIGWLLEEAAGRGHNVSRDHVFSLFAAALREIRSKSKTSRGT